MHPRFENLGLNFEVPGATPISSQRLMDRHDIWRSINRRERESALLEARQSEKVVCFEAISEGRDVSQIVTACARFDYSFGPRQVVVCAIRGSGVDLTRDGGTARRLQQAVHGR